MKRHQINKAAWRPGTAMSEFVLALPLLLVVLALMLFMGSAMLNKQHVVVANRYVAWQAADGIGRDDEVEIDRDFFDDRAQRVNVDGQAGPSDAADYWVEEASDYESGAGRLADDLIRQQWPQGRQYVLQADFPSVVPVHRSIRQDLSFQHGREGLEWVFPHVNEWLALRDRYYGDLSSLLSSISGGAGEALSTEVREFSDDPNLRPLTRPRPIRTPTQIISRVPWPWNQPIVSRPR